MKSYDTTVDGYLTRCKEHRDNGTLQSLLYAALELRMGVEARLAESVQAVSGLTVAQRRQWRVVHLANTLQTTNWSNGDDILVLLVRFEEPDEIFQLNYFPVTKRLTGIVGQLGDYLHRNERLVSDQATVHRELESLVKEGYGELLAASSSELLGLPQLDPQTGTLNLAVRFSEGDTRAFALSQAFQSGRKYLLQPTTFTPLGRPTFYDAD